MQEVEKINKYNNHYFVFRGQKDPILHFLSGKTAEFTLALNFISSSLTR